MIPPKELAAAAAEDEGEAIDSSDAALKAMQSLLSRCNSKHLPRSPWNAPQLTSFANWTSNGAGSSNCGPHPAGL